MAPDMSSEPIPAVRAKPGEYYLAAEAIHAGDRFKSGSAVYEIVGDPTPLGGGAFMVSTRMTEGRAAGKDFHAVLHVGKRVDG